MSEPLDNLEEIIRSAKPTTKKEVTGGTGDISFGAQYGGACDNNKPLESNTKSDGWGASRNVHAGLRTQESSKIYGTFEIASAASSHIFKDEKNREEIHLNGLSAHYRHKNGWSWLLGSCILVLTIFQMVVIGLVGGGVWNFKDYPTLLPALMIQYLIQIVALATYVVKCLFDSMSDQQPPRQSKQSPSKAKASLSERS